MNGPSWQPAQQVLDDYRIDRTIGMGGMGQVYLVTSLSTGSRFAVKKSLVAGPEGRRRFLSELAIWFGLPEYRHFARCQFFRTCGARLLDLAGLRAEIIAE